MKLLVFGSTGGTVASSSSRPLHRGIPRRRSCAIRQSSASATQPENRSGDVMDLGIVAQAASGPATARHDFRQFRQGDLE